MQDVILKALKTWPAEGHFDNRYEFLSVDLTMDADNRMYLLDIDQGPSETDILKPRFSLYRTVLTNVVEC